jgi:flagellar biosynthesis protein FliP
VEAGGVKRIGRRPGRACAALAFLAVLLAPAAALALQIPALELRVGEAGSPAEMSTLVKIVGLLTVLSLAPAILVTMTAFTRIAVVLSFVRHALGVQGMPPNQVMISLALFLTLFVMAPVGRRIHEEALRPYLDGRIGDAAALDAAVAPVRSFMLAQTREKDLALFYEMAKSPRPARPDDVSLTLLLPAFVTSELRTAFEMGFLIFLPFLLVDLIVSSVLMSMGMVMLPPALIALPLKVMLFVLADGWHLVVGSVTRSFA